jgi:hypothetical protein
MTFGAEVWGPALIGAAGSIGGGFLSGRSSRPKETKMQKTQRHLVEQLIASLNGDGPFSSLFASDPEVFKKSFVEPAQAMFRNQIAPQIQQSYIAGGQQRGTGLDDQLLRAGVDLDSLLNQQMYQFNQDAQNRKFNTINSILGGGAGAPAQRSSGDDLMASLGGYLASDSFGNAASGLFKSNSTAPAQTQNAYAPRKGFDVDNWGGQY